MKKISLRNINFAKYFLIFFAVLLFPLLGITADAVDALDKAVVNQGTTMQGLQDILDGETMTTKLLQLVVLISVLGVSPSLIIMMTSFVRIIIVFSFIRSAIGMQQSPPNQVLASLAMFLTFFIMSPVIQESYNSGYKPWSEERITEGEAFHNMSTPFKNFMLKNTREKDLNLFTGIAKLDEKISNNDIPIHVVIPSFMISELRRAFEIGFLVFLPFLIIDILVSSILMAMGMMMMPPVTIALPFKVVFFVMIDGWHLIVGSLIQSFA